MECDKLSTAEDFVAHQTNDEREENSFKNGNTAARANTEGENVNLKLQTYNEYESSNEDVKLSDNNTSLSNGSGFITEANCTKDSDNFAERNMHLEHSEGSDTESIEVKLDANQQKKVYQILNYLDISDLKGLKQSAVSEHGLVTDDIRRKVWPKLMGVDVYATSPRPTKDEVESHPYYQQVLLDVNRSLKRFPPSIKEKRRLAMQDQLVLLIMRVLVKNPALHYYQGYHDICVTFLLVLGEEISFHVVEKLSVTHLHSFMQKSMDPTSEMLHYMYPIIEREKPHLYQFLDKSEVGILFALSWLITWFGHVLSNYMVVVRLFDFFIVSSYWMPVYLSTALVLQREQDILKAECDMASVHSLLLNIPKDLNFEDLIIKSRHLYCKYPPESIKNAVKTHMENKKRKFLAARRPQNRGVIAFITKTVTSFIPQRKVTVSFVLAATVLIGAVVYQVYKA